MSAQLNQAFDVQPAATACFCARCESAGHVVASCPFPDDEQTYRLAVKRRTRRIESRAAYVAPAPDDTPLPEFCGPSDDFVPYTWTPEHRSLRAARARSARYSALAFYRIQAQRAAARGNVTAASWYGERAAMYARILRPRVAAFADSVEAEKPATLMDELRSWLVMSEVIAAEAHLTAEDYMYA